MGSLEDLQGHIAALEAELARIAATDRISSATRHDLLTPLNSIIGYSSLILDRGANLDERQRKNLERIRDAGNALVGAIRALGVGPSAPGMGASVVAPAAKKPAFLAPGDVDAVAAAKPREGKVFVVDDVEDMRELVKLHLEAKGYSVETAESGDECLARAREIQPSCVVLDIEMPGKDGLETCRLLKADAMTSHIPVLFLTGHADDEKLAVRALAAGGNDLVPKPYAPSILLARVNSQVAIHEAQTRLRQAVMTDELTGVFSRRFLYESMRQQLKALHRSGPPSVAVLLIDVDHFKIVNDTHGHLEGDAALRNVAATLRRHVRGSDVVARFGGEEFVVVLPTTRIEGAMFVAEKLRRAVEDETRTERAPLTISIGVSAREIATSTEPEADTREQEVMDALIREADEALYKAKAAGRNKVVRFA